MNPIGDSIKTMRTQMGLLTSHFCNANVACNLEYVGFGIFEKNTKNWVYAYEAYLTNGFDESIISNSRIKHFCLLPKKMATALKKVSTEALADRKIAVKNSKIGELIILYGWGVQ